MTYTISVWDGVIPADATMMEDYFGENIDKSLFEDEMITTAQLIRKRKKSLYELESVRKEMSPETDKYVFITIFSQHASVVVVDKELFDRVFFTPVFGQMITGWNLKMDPNYEKLAGEVPLQQYHVCLDDRGTKYILARNMYYISWFMKSRSFFAGETALAYLHLQLLCLLVVPSRYRLVLDDCLEFAKRFVSEIAINEGDVREKELDVFFRTIRVSEGYITASLEERSRQNRASALSAALSYFSSFRLERMLIMLIFLVIICTLVYYVFYR